MHDLLNEHDFIKPQYNPWPLFRRFYAIAVVQVIILQLCVSFLIHNANGVIMFFVYLLFPVVTVVWMFTTETHSFLLERKVKMMGITGLVTCFSVSNLFINIVKIVFRHSVNFLTDLASQIIAGILFFVIQLGVCMVVMYLVSSVLRSKLKKAN